MNNTQTLTLRNDYLFKLLLGSEENKICLQDFLECILDIPTGAITDLELLDKELTKDTITDKTGILDVKLRLKDETTIDIEITFPDRHPCLSGNTSFAFRQNIASAKNHRHPWRYGYGKKASTNRE